MISQPFHGNPNVNLSTASENLDTNVSAIDSCTKINLMAVQRWPQNDNAPLTHSLTATSRLADGLCDDDDEQCCEEKKHEILIVFDKNIMQWRTKQKLDFSHPIPMPNELWKAIIGYIMNIEKNTIKICFKRNTDTRMLRVQCRRCLGRTNERKHIDVTRRHNWREHLATRAVQNVHHAGRETVAKQRQQRHVTQSAGTRRLQHYGIAHDQCWDLCWFVHVVRKGEVFLNARRFLPM